MAVTSSIATIADSIAGLTVSGVTLRDIDQIPDSASMLCPLFMPQPAGYITSYVYSRESFGSNGSAAMNSTYVLNYIYLHCEVGSGVNAFAPYASIYTKLELILEKIFANDAITGLVDIQLDSIGNVGVITDPAGNEFWGLLLSFKVLEYNQ